ncbi:MAG: hypothetical protein AAB495_01225 [Patescibacteria group bacterium]
MYPIGTKKLAVLMAVGTVLGGFLPTTLNAITTAATYEEIPSIQIQEAQELDRWIERLILLESEGRTNITILDVNNKHSFGCLQFQKATFVSYGKRYGLLGSSDDVMKKIYDCELQKKLAKRMIEESHRNWRHWYTSVQVKKLGPPPVVREAASQPSNIKLALEGSRKDSR